MTPAGPVEVTHDTLLPHATWRAPDGTVAFVFANARMSTEVSFHFTVAAETCGIATDGTWALYSLKPGSDGSAALEQVSVIDGAVVRDEGIEAGGVLILVAKPMEGTK